MTWTVTDNGSREDDGALPGNRLQPSFNLPIEIEVRDLSVFYGKQQALFEVSVDIPARRVTAFIGPSGSGKSSFLRVLNRTLDLVPGARLAGTVLVNGEDITLLNPNGTAITRLRRRVGMLFQRPNPFPLSIFENVAYGIRSEGRQLQSELPTIVERSLQQVGLWGEVKHRLGQSALQLSLGQQQLLCLARAGGRAGGVAAGRAVRHPRPGRDPHDGRPDRPDWTGHHGDPDDLQPQAGAATGALQRRVSRRSPDRVRPDPSPLHCATGSENQGHHRRLLPMRGVSTGPGYPESSFQRDQEGRSSLASCRCAGCTEEEAANMA